MKITIHQAIYGEVNGAWDLLQTTMENVPEAKKLRFQTDLQERAPTGIYWQPTIRGFSVNELYVITKTYPDTSQDVRAGRVFSHSLIVEKKHLTQINDLSVLFKYFSTSLNKSINLSIISYSTDAQKIPEIKPELIPRFKKVIHGLVESNVFQNKIVWVGEKGFEEIICQTWQRLTKTERENFYFGISFNPKELSSNDLTLVTTPISLENNWNNSSFCIIKENEDYELKTFFEHFLFGDERAYQSLNNFIIEIEASPSTREDFKFLSKGVEIFENLNSCEDFNSINMLFQLCSEYSRNKRKGIEFKNKLLRKFCKVVEKSNEREILALQGIKTSAIDGSEKQLSSALRVWLTNNLFDSSANKTTDFSKVISQYNNSQKSWWQNTFTSELKNFVSLVTLDKSEILWQWILRDVNTLKQIDRDLDRSYQAETNLITNFPKKLDIKDLPKLRDFAIARRWFRFHGTLLISLLNFESAIKAHLKVDDLFEELEAIKIITDKGNSKEVLNFAIQNGDPRLLTIASELCYKEPSLLKSLDTRKINWRTVWLGSIRKGNQIDQGLLKPSKKILEIFDLLLDGDDIEEELLVYISKSEYANLFVYKNRSELWLRIPPIIRTTFLRKTAEFFLERLSKDPSTEIPNDEILEDFIVNNGIHDFLYYNRNDFKKTLPIFLMFTKLNEEILGKYIYYYNGNLDYVDATQLGKLVNHLDSRYLANTIYSKSKANSQFKVALNECFNQLSYFDRGNIVWFGFLDNIIFTEEQWWEAFQETACSLYSGGPRDRKIWAEAGGEEYDLLSFGSGKEQWVDAVTKLRKGFFKKISIEKLLKKMRKEHPKYEPLTMLENLRKLI